MKYVIPIIAAIIVSIVIFLIGNQFPKQSFVVAESHQETIQTISEIATSFNDRRRILIETDAGFYFINSIVSVKRNEKIMVETGTNHFNDSRMRLCIRDKCYKVIN